MNRRMARKALRKVAKINGISVAEVKREIELATECARNDSDSITQARWASVPTKKDKPTAVEVVAHFSKSIRHKMK